MLDLPLSGQDYEECIGAKKHLGLGLAGPYCAARSLRLVGGMRPRSPGGFRHVTLATRPLSTGSVSRSRATIGYVGSLPKRLHHHRALREDHVDVAFEDFCHKRSDPCRTTVCRSQNNLDLLWGAVTGRT
jgi:hypothetical protein